MGVDEFIGEGGLPRKKYNLKEVEEKKESIFN